MAAGVSWRPGSDKRRAAHGGPEREREDEPRAIRLFVEAPLDAGAAVALASGAGPLPPQRDAPGAGGSHSPLQRPRRGVGGRRRRHLAPPRRRPPRAANRRAASGTRCAAPVRAAQGRAHPLRGREGDRAGRRRHPPGPHPIRPDQRASMSSGSAPTPSRRRNSAAAWRCRRSIPPAPSPTRSPTGRRSAGCWCATPRLNPRSPTRWPAAPARPGPSGRPGGWLRAVRTAPARRSSRLPFTPAWARASCAPRPPSRQPWPAGRPSRATGDEAAPRRTQPCHAPDTRASIGWTAAPE